MEFKKVLVLVMFLTMFVILSFHKFIFFNTGKPKIDNVIARDQELTLRFSSKGTYFSTEKSVTGIFQAILTSVSTIRFCLRNKKRLFMLDAMKLFKISVFRS